MPADPCTLSVKLSSGKTLEFEAWGFSCFGTKGRSLLLRMLTRRGLRRTRREVEQSIAGESNRFDSSSAMQAASGSHAM